MSAVWDVKILSDLRLADLQTYLARQGWQRDSSSYPRADVWFLQDRSDVDIVLPREPGVVDYLARLADAVETLSRVETRAPFQIVRDVQAVLADVIRVRRHSHLSSGTIRLEDGVQLVEHAMTLVTAVACSAVTPRAVVPSRRPLIAEHYLSKVQLGQTEIGSFVLTIHSPVDAVPSDENESLFPELEGEPFARKVTTTLVRALSSVRAATQRVRESGDYSTFAEGVRDGISANLCDAIAGMMQSESRQDDVDISLDWAKSVQEPKSPVAFEFERSQVDILREAASRFRAAEPAVDALITGSIVSLSRDDSDIERHVTVACHLDGKPRRLRVPLGPADYQKAIDAHRDKKPVLFRADIERVGRVFTAGSVRDWRVLG